MADEIKVRAELSVVKGSVWEGLAVRDLLVTQTGTNVIRNVQAVGTAEEAIQLGDAGAGGWFMAVNRGPTNYVELRASSGQVAFAKLLVNESCGPFRLGASAVPTAQANTAGIDLEVLLIEA